MPYIVIKSNGQVIDRRELTGSTVIGRAPDCDITVRDILLSRRHCELEETQDGWVLIDLESKNGTALNGKRVNVPRSMENDDVIRLGRSEIIFRTGVLDEDGFDSIDVLMSPDRPANPGDSISGTLSGFTLLLPGESAMPQNMPCPQPQPREPAAFQEKELQTLLTAIASSSWDSIYAEVRKPSRSSVEKIETEVSETRRRVRPHSPMDLSLQVNSSSSAAEDLPTEETSPRIEMKLHWRSRKVWMQAAAAVLWMTIGILLARHWSEQTGSGPMVQSAMAASIPGAQPASLHQTAIAIPDPSDNLPTHAMMSTSATTMPVAGPSEDLSLDTDLDVDSDSDSTLEKTDPAKASEKTSPVREIKLQGLHPNSFWPATESAAGYIPILF